MDLSAIQGQLLLDDYDRKARLLPGLLVILPVIITLMTLFPMSKTYATAAAVVALFGGPMVLAEWVRMYGRKQEAILFPVMPTTVLLRHRDRTINTITKRRYHHVLQESVPGIKLPTPEDEAVNPNEADCQYESAVCWLREMTRNHVEYPLVFRELMHYGFLVNLMGVKPLGLVCASIGAVADAAALYLKATPPLSYIALGASLMMGSVWLVYVNKYTVLAAGRDYAKSLLAACDRIGL